MAKFCKNPQRIADANTTIKLYLALKHTTGRIKKVAQIHIVLKKK